jgi:hypothetical protein
MPGLTTAREALERDFAEQAAARFDITRFCRRSSARRRIGGPKSAASNWSVRPLTT